MRLAIEGCGHGTLDAIYASIGEACQARDWDGVDLVIIGGDFQAVRDRQDLNVTAMPAKYREMADFHQYYLGHKHAPFLTIFIGGNHEASNHLAELYYGGWVAPNIYYLGAANVVRFGNIKIASMSGIWKGYDYRKPHYERLPYSNDDIYSIYHVREIDVRKLLAYRSQVDIGVSHDWPKGIEWLGNHQQLFKYKRHLREDAETGRLGSVAAQKVMDRLRPAYWFSAHLHCKYTAVKTHSTEAHESKSQIQSHSTGASEATLAVVASDQPKVNAWRNFQVSAKMNEAQETAQLNADFAAKREQAEQSGQVLMKDYVFNETYKKIKLENKSHRSVTSVTFSTGHGGTNDNTKTRLDTNVPQLDGCCASLAISQSQSNPSANDISRRHQTFDNTENAASATNATTLQVSSANPDAIDVDMSSDNDSSGSDLRADVSPRFDDETAALIKKRANYEREMPSEDNGEADETARVGGHLMATVPTSTLDNASVQSMRASVKFVHPQGGVGSICPPLPIPTRGSSLDKPGRSDVTTHADGRQGEEGVSDEMRAQLAALSSKFGGPDAREASTNLPFPDSISNKVTRFLALSKCERNQNFLQLLEIEPLTTTDEVGSNLPSLCYDVEWLAILRVFAPELEYGGDPGAKIPQHKGDVFYRERILEEVKWVEEYVRDLKVPENFVRPLARNEPRPGDVHTDMPWEVTNNQTVDFCQLIGIENKFDASEEERAARRASAATLTEREGSGSRRGGASHHQRGGQRGGPAFARGGGRGRSRGRAQGRGRW